MYLVILFIGSSEWCCIVKKHKNCHDSHIFSLFRFIINLSTGIPVMYCLLEVVSVCPQKLAPRFVDKIDWIKVSIYFYVYLDVGWWQLYIRHLLCCD